MKLVNGTLSSVTDAMLLIGVNTLAVQNADGGWEVVQFATAMLTGPGEYTLTRLKRGRRGSEVQMRGSVAAGARVVVVDGALAQLSLTQAQARLPFQLRWGPASRPMADVSWQGVACALEAVALIPLAPCHVDFDWTASGDLTLRWKRRDRDPAASHIMAAVTPFREAVERYDLEILNAGSVVRTFSAVPQHSQTYTAAQQATDFPTGLPGPLTVRVYQLSSATGRGRMKQEDLYVR